LLDNTCSRLVQTHGKFYLTQKALSFEEASGISGRWSLPAKGAGASKERTRRLETTIIILRAAIASRCSEYALMQLMDVRLDGSCCKRNMCSTTPTALNSREQPVYWIYRVKGRTLEHSFSLPCMCHKTSLLHALFKTRIGLFDLLGLLPGNLASHASRFTAEGGP